MNYLAAEAELAVRGPRWGSGLGGVNSENREFCQIVSGDVVARLEDETRLLIEEQKRAILKGEKAARREKR